MAAIVLVLAALAVAALAFAPVLRGSGALLNQDHPQHFQRLWGFVNGPSHALVPSWNPHMNAGRPYFHAYPVLFHELGRAWAWVAGPVLAYKLALVSVHLLAAAGVWALLAAAGRSLAGGFAAALCLVAAGSPQSGGFVQLVVVGLAPSSLATALLPWALAGLVAWFRNPSRRRLGLAAVAAAALMLAHPFSFVLFTLWVPMVAIAYRRELFDPASRSQRVWLLAWPPLTVGLAGFWLLPLLWRRLEGHFGAALGDAGVTRSMYSPELFLKYFWAPLSKPLLGFALVGLVVALISSGPGRRARRALVAMFWVVPALWCAELYAPWLIEASGLDRVVQLQRLAADQYLLLCVFAGLALGDVALGTITLGGRPRPVGWLVAVTLTLALGGSLGRRTVAMAERNIHLLQPEMEAKHREFYGLLAKRPGRVLHQETMFLLPGPLGQTHLEALMPTYHGGESLSFDSFAFQEDWGDRDLIELLTERARDAASQRVLFERLNIRFAITTTARGEKVLRGVERVGTVAPWTLHATRIEPSWFALDSGAIEASTYDQWTASADVTTSAPGRLLFKVHDYPNWHVTIDGRPATRVNHRGSLMELQVPPGRHRFEMRYGLTALDWLAYAVTAVSAVLVAALLRPTHAKAPATANPVGR